MLLEHSSPRTLDKKDLTTYTSSNQRATSSSRSSSMTKTTIITTRAVAKPGVATIWMGSKLTSDSTIKMRLELKWQCPPNHTSGATHKTTMAPPVAASKLQVPMIRKSSLVARIKTTPKQTTTAAPTSHSSTKLRQVEEATSRATPHLPSSRSIASSSKT